MTPAPLVVDVQFALCSGAEKAFDIERVIQRINAVSAKARAANAFVCVVQHEEARGTLQFESAGLRLDERLDVRDSDFRARKTTPDSYHEMDLQTSLLARDVDQLIVCGLQSKCCVDSTVRKSFALGYPVVLVADAHSTVDNGVLSAAQISAHHSVTLAGISSFGPKVTLRKAADVRFDG